MITKRVSRATSLTKQSTGTRRSISVDSRTKPVKRSAAPVSVRAKKETPQPKHEAPPTFTYSQSNSFGTWADTWYEDHKTQVQPSTYSNYRFTLNLLKEAFGEVMIDAIRPLDINQYLNRLMGEGCSPSKINKCRAMLLQIFDFAAGNDAITRNPARFAKHIRNTDYTSSKDAFTEEEFEIMMNDLPDNKLGHSIRSLLGSGMRVQELLALMPDEIADDGSSIRICRAVKMVDGKAEEGCPKSKSGYRVIPIPEAFRESVRYLKTHASGKYVWCANNKLHCVGTFRKWYYRALKELVGVRALPPHCCRHTYVSRLEARGVPMEVIARLAGHSKIATTNGYLHIRESTLQNAVDVLNDAAAQSVFS